MRLAHVFSVLIACTVLAVSATALAAAQQVQEKDPESRLLGELRDLLDAQVLTPELNARAERLLEQLGAKGIDELTDVAVQERGVRALNAVRLLRQAARSKDAELADKATRALEKIASSDAQLAPLAGALLRVVRVEQMAAGGLAAIPGVRSLRRRMDGNGWQVVASTDSEWIRIRQPWNGPIDIVLIDLEKEPPDVVHLKAASPEELKKKNPKAFEWYQKLRVNGPGGRAAKVGAVVQAVASSGNHAEASGIKNALAEIRQLAKRLSARAQELAESPDVTKRDLRMLAESIKELADRLEQLSTPRSGEPSSDLQRE